PAPAGGGARPGGGGLGAEGGGELGAEGGGELEVIGARPGGGGRVGARGGGREGGGGDGGRGLGGRPRARAARAGRPGRVAVAPEPRRDEQAEHPRPRRRRCARPCAAHRSPLGSRRSASSRARQPASMIANAASNCSCPPRTGSGTSA